MSADERDKLVKFCVLATADLNGVEVIDVDPKEFLDMDDDTLLKEADWLDDVLNK